MDRGNRYYSIRKEKKELFVDAAARKSKGIPGVGRYDPHLALDKVARPVMRRR